MRRFRTVAAVSVLVALASALVACQPPPVGTITTFGDNLPGADVGSMTSGPDGNLWMTVASPSELIVLSPAGPHLRITGSGIDGPGSITAGPDGALWFTNADSIGRVTTTGVVTIFRDPTVLHPAHLSVGGDGALWFVNTGSATVGRITTAGAVSALPALPAVPDDMTTGPDGNQWALDHTDGTVVRITTTGVVTTYPATGLTSSAQIVLGPDGNLWFSGDGLSRFTTAGAETTFSGTPQFPRGLVAGPDGNLWTTNSNATIWKISTSGVVLARFGPDPTLRPETIATGPDGALWFSSTLLVDRFESSVGSDTIGRISTAGTVTRFGGAGISGPTQITAGPDGAMWFTNLYTRSAGRVDMAGNVSNITGLPANPSSIATGPDGNLWFTDCIEIPDFCSSATVGRLTPAGVVTTFSDAKLRSPYSITAGPDGALWFADHGASRIGRISTTGAITTFTGAGVAKPVSITNGPDGALWFLQADGSVGRITPAGTITVFATGGGSDNTSASGITTGPDGNVWFIDTRGAVDRITPTGTVTRFPVAGSYLSGLATGPDGNLWFTTGSSIGRLTPAGTVTAYGDSSASALGFPRGIAAGPDGNMWFVDRDTDKVGRIITGA